MKTSCNIASPEFISWVEAIEPSVKAYNNYEQLRPCQLILKDGRIIPRAICVEDHRGFVTDGWIHPDSVEQILPSLERMPARLATKLYHAGESGMGYQLFTMKMKDGSSHIFVTSNVVEFPDFANGYGTNDVDDVYPHHGREQTKLGYQQERSFEWCFYVRG